MKAIQRVFIDPLDSATCSYKNNCFKLILIMLFCINCSLSASSQFTEVNVPHYPGGFSFWDTQIDFDDMLTGYFAAFAYFSPSGGGEFWLYQTVDGGVTWTEKSIFGTGPSFLCRFLYAVNSDICYISFWTNYSDCFLRKSYAGNGNTSHIYFESFDIEPRSINKLNDTVLYMTAKHWRLPNGPYSYLYRIGGDNYSEVYSIREDSLQLLKPLFISPDTGFIISYYPSDHIYTILRTSDAGLSWQSCFLNDSLTITDIGFFTHSAGVISCSNGYLFRTVDAGINWESIKLEDSNTINCLDLIDENIGYCGGDSGSFYITSNQGQSWNIVPFINTKNIIRLHMIVENYGYISTSSRTFYKYSDIGSIKETEFSVFPNPANDIINIVFPRFIEGQYEVNLINALGILIYSDTKTGNRFSLDLSGYATGIYFLIVKKGAAQSIRKIIRK